MWNERLKYLIKEENVELLANSRVAVVGVGGVGSFAAEALARSGIGHITLVDHDVIDETNINRQIHALHSTVGLKKVEVMRKRILDINPECEVVTYDTFINAETITQVLEKRPDFIVDAIDTITCKLDLVQYAQENEIPIICSLGMANRLDPTQIIVTRLDKTEGDPLARSMRQQARKRKMSGKIPVVFSKEKPMIQNTIVHSEGVTRKEKYPVASSAFVPSAAGLAIASYVVRTLIDSKAVHRIVVAGGCFWGVQEYYRRCKGIEDTKVGYAQCNQSSCTYEEVKYGDTHAVEAVELMYNSSISLEKILELLFRIIDPTSLNRQKNDIGEQYRTGVYYEKENDREIIETFLRQKQKEFQQPIVVECLPLENFIVAEEYHQNYLVKHPNGYCHVDFSQLKEEDLK
ncbi:MAG: peptide-methionine (S)-S-oxide reductase MsrA [Erysipelotrichaceae bacterium]|nr:peptide-methionine (S)-S-oxide reductase MsrA [Erysipelotrichaceae bacterium]